MSTLYPRISVPKSLLGVLGRSAIDVESDNIRLVGALLSSVLGSLDFRHVSKTAKCIFTEQFIFCCQGVVRLAPLQSFQQLCLRLGQVACIRAEEFLEDDEGGVWRC